VPQIETSNYSVRWSGSLTVPAPGHYVFTLETGDSFPYSPAETYRLLIDGKVVSEGSLRQSGDISSMGNFHSEAGASPTAPPMMQFPRFLPSPTTSATPTLTSSNSNTPTPATSPAADSRLNGKPQPRPARRGRSQAKQADVIVAFVGLSPELEGEEMPIKIEGFTGGDRTSIDLPAPQQKLLEDLSATGKPLIVVLQSGAPSP